MKLKCASRLSLNYGEAAGEGGCVLGVCAPAVRGLIGHRSPRSASRVAPHAQPVAAALAPYLLAQSSKLASNNLQIDTTTLEPHCHVSTSLACFEVCSLRIATGRAHATPLLAL